MTDVERGAAATPISVVPVVIDGISRLVEVTPDGLISSITTGSAHPLNLIRWTGGFVDIHVHGGGGHSFDHATRTELDDALAIHHRHGVRRSLLSLVSAPSQALVEQLQALAILIRGRTDIAGVHLEGPFISPERKGAHDRRGLEVPTPAAVDALIEAGDGILRQITIAPELPGAMEAIDRFIAAGITVAVGHTAADADTAAAAFDKGASLVTHGLNAMPCLGHRDVGPVGAALQRDHVTIELIADGLHIHPVIIKTLFAAAPSRIALVSDAMCAAGARDGTYRLGTRDVTVTDGRPVLTGTETLAGSTLTLDRAVEIATRAGVSVDDAIAAATLVPAQAIGIDAPAVRVGDRLDSLVAIDSSGRRLETRP